MDKKKCEFDQGACSQYAVSIWEMGCHEEGCTYREVLYLCENHEVMVRMRIINNTSLMCKGDTQLGRHSIGSKDCYSRLGNA